MNTQTSKEVPVPSSQICTSVTIDLTQVVRVCMESSLFHAATAQFILFTLYFIFLLEDQEPILGHYFWQQPF